MAKKKEEKEAEIEKETEVKEEVSKKIEKEEKVEKEPKKKKEGFFKGLRKEMKQVVWPTAGSVLKSTISVILICIFLCLFFEAVALLAAFIKGLFA